MNEEQIHISSPTPNHWNILLIFSVCCLDETQAGQRTHNIAKNKAFI